MISWPRYTDLYFGMRNEIYILLQSWQKKIIAFKIKFLKYNYFLIRIEVAIKNKPNKFVGMRNAK